MFENELLPYTFPGGKSFVYKHFLVYHKIANVAHSNLSHATTSARKPYYHLLILAAARRVGCDIPTRAILRAFAFFGFFRARSPTKTLKHCTQKHSLLSSAAITSKGSTHEIESVELVYCNIL
jgi:hypothetical protein